MSLNVVAQYAPVSSVETGHRLRDVEWRPDGSLLAVATDTGVQVFNNNLVKIVEFAAEDVTSLSWSPDGSKLATGSESVHIWEYNDTIQAFTQIASTNNQYNFIPSLLWSTDGTKLAAIGADTSGATVDGYQADIQIWNTTTWSALGTPYRVFAPSRSLAWSPDNSRLAIGHQGKVTVLASNTLMPEYEIEFLRNPDSMSWSTSDELTIVHFNEVFVINGETGELSKIFHLANVPNIYRISGGRDPRIAAFNTSNSVIIVDIATENVLREFSVAENLRELHWRSDGERIVTISIEGTIEIWDTSDFVNVAVFPTANASPDQIITDGNNSGSKLVTLDGSGSSDSDGTIVSYSWQENGVEIATGVNPTVALAVGVHTITLVVTDDDGATGIDTVVIEIFHRS
ncbi:MAG: hypothetical protein OHK0046_42050 [Anaerolineae bacterium]